MDSDGRSSSDCWCVVVFANVPGGMVYPIVRVVTTPGPWQRRSTRYPDVAGAVRPAVDTIVTSHPERLAAMPAPLRPDLITSGGSPWPIPPQMTDFRRLRAISRHPALPPRHCGPHPVEWTFRCGDAVMGFTVHPVDPSFDTGPDLARRCVPIAEDDDVEVVMSRMFEMTSGVLARDGERLVVQYGDAPLEILAWHDVDAAQAA